MKINSIKLYFLIFLVNFLISSAFASAEPNSQFVIVYQMPPSIPWTIIKEENNSDGYLKMLQPETSDGSDQSLLINFGKNIHTSLRDSMKQVLAVQSRINCLNKQVQIVAERDNYLVFTTTLANCSNGKVLKEIYKVFNMPDGQYSLNYTADSNKIDSATITRMQNMIKNAKIVPLSH